MKTLLTALALGLLLVFAACGGDDDDEVDATDPPAETPTASATLEDSPGPTPSDEPEPPTELTDEMIEAIAIHVAANDMFGERREMTEPPRCEDTEGDATQAGKVCIAANSFTNEGENAVVNAGLWASDAIATFVLAPDGDGWLVDEVRDANDVGDPTELTHEMIAAIAAYVAANDLFGERREMTDPPNCDEAVGDSAQYLGKICYVPSTFTLEGGDVLVTIGIWSSDGVVTAVLRQVDGEWRVVELRPVEGGEQ